MITGATEKRARALIDFEQLFLNSAGRTGRAPFAIGVFVLVAVLGLIERIVPDVLRAWFGWIADLLLVFAAFAVICKRLHDLGVSGWWAGFGLLAFVNVWPQPRGVGWLFLVLLIVGGAWLAFTPGQRGFNRFGPPTTSDR